MDRRNGLNYAFRIAVGLMMLALLMAGGAGALSNSGGGSWQYSKEITVKENSGSTLTDYQILVQLSGANFITSALPSGADIRFTDTDSAELKYWFESWDNVGKSAKIWVKIPSITAGATSTIRMWYGNPSASSSNNGDSTFDFFDDFSEDLSKWEFLHPTDWVKTADNTLKHTTTTISLAGFYFQNSDLIMEGRLKTLSTRDQYTGFFLRSNVLDPNSVDGGYFGLGGYYCLYCLWKGGPIQSEGWVVSGSNSDIQTDTWYAFKGIFHGTNIEVYGDPNQASATTLRLSTNSALAISGSYMGLESGFVANNEWDDVRVRKYASPEPSINVGADAVQISAIVNVQPDTLNKASQGNPVTAYIYIELPGYDVNNIEVSTVKLRTNKGEVSTILSSAEVGDHNGNGIPDLMVKFDRQAVIGIVDVGDVLVTISGKISGEDFEGTDVIRVIDNHKQIPEFPTVALPILSVIGLMFLLQRRKGK